MIPNLDSIGAYADRLMVDAAVWSVETVVTPGGGHETTWVDQGRTVRVQLVSPSPAEKQAAAQLGVEVTHSAVMPVDVEVSRGDRLVVGDLTVQLVSDPVVATHSAVSRAQARQEPWRQPSE